MGEKPPLAVWTTDGGVEYKVLAIGYLYFHGDSERMLAVKYVSKNPFDPQVRRSEFHDMYTMVAQKLKLDNVGSVGLEAVNKPPKAFGVSSSSGYRDRKSVDEVRRLVEIPPNKLIRETP